MIQLMQGDCLERMKEIPDGSVDMILADPPYGTTACKWDSIIPLEPMWAQLKRVIKPNGAIVMTASQPFTTILIASNMKMFKENLVWVKHKPSNFGNAKTRHMKYHEDVLVFSQKRHTYNPQMIKRISQRILQGQKSGWKKRTTVRNDRQEVSFSTLYEPKDVMEYSADSKLPSTILNGYYLTNNSADKTTHPTQKPVALMEYLIKTYTNEGETVLDFTMGSGTTGVACVNLKRSFIGIELDENYFNIAKARIEQAQLIRPAQNNLR